jgi:hypothetical protein
VHGHSRVTRVTIKVPEHNADNHGGTPFTAEFTTIPEAIPALGDYCARLGWEFKYNASEEVLRPSVIVEQIKQLGRKRW